MIDMNESMIPDYTPRSGKIEWHITYKCNLGCRSCSRCAWIKPPHTRDMTLADAEKCIKQANEIGWKNKPGPGNGAEPPRVVIIGGEPTLHPQFLDFVKLAREWTGTYSQVYSNGYTDETKRLLRMARNQYNASIVDDGFKTGPRQDETDGKQKWFLETYVSPSEVGLPITICYCHSSSICGIGYDASGFSPCPIGMMVSKILGVNGVTRNIADLYDREKMHAMTMEICRHCGYEGQNRFGPTQQLGKFKEYAEACKKLSNGAPVSPIWKQAFNKIGIN